MTVHSNVHGCPMLAGAELGNVLNEAALEAVRRGGQEIVQRDIDFAVDRVLQVRGFQFCLHCCYYYI